MEPLLKDTGPGRDFLVVQWLRFCTSTAGDIGPVPDEGTKILHAAQHGRKKKRIKDLVAKLISFKDSFFFFLNFA